MATPKKPAKKVSAKGSGSGPKRSLKSSTKPAEVSYSMHIQLEIMLFSLLSIIFLIMAIVQYS